MINFRNISGCTTLALLLLAACSPASPPAPAASATPPPTPTARSADNPPFQEAEVPRISVADAKAAFDNGQAVLVDVRGTADYERAHIAGALSIQLGEFETNAAGVPLDREQWIITYCT